MAFQQVPDTAEAVVQYLCNSVLFTNTYYFSFVGAYLLADLQDLAEAIDLWAGTEMRPLVAVSTSYVQTHVRGLDAANDLEAVNSNSAGVGAGGTTPLPLNVAWALKRISGKTGRSARGRVYIGGLATSALATDENYLLTTWAENLQNAHNDMTGYLSELAWYPVIVSRYSNGATRIPAITFPIESWEYTDTRLDSRRDRLPSPG